jgi:hypothetical protein
MMIIVSTACSGRADFINLIGDKECLNCDVSSDEAKARGWGPTVQGLTLSISISNATSLVGEPIIASVAMRNVTNTPSVFPLTFPPACFALSVVRANEAAVPPSDYARRVLLGSGGVNTMKWGLGPNEALKLRYPLDRAYDLTEPGEYLVTARYVIFNPRTTNSVYLISNTVTVKVAAASSEVPKGK